MAPLVTFDFIQGSATVGPTQAPVLKVGSAAESTYLTPSLVGMGVGIKRNWPGRSMSHQSSMEWSSCWGLWQCSM
jgi:hypothetical protein